MLDDIKNEVLNLVEVNYLNQNFDCLAFAVIDFQSNKFLDFEIADNGEISERPFLYFDLASLTKPLSMGASYLYNPALFNYSDLLLLEHRSGLPAWGRLGHQDWKEQLMSYKISESPTLYSDFGAIRLKLELEKKSKKPFKELCSDYWHEELVHWKDLPLGSISPLTGIRNRQNITGVVHDDNAFVMNEFSTHAGLFATVSGLAQSLLNLNQEVDFISKVEKSLIGNRPERFRYAWDTVAQSENSLAGRGHSKHTFGHLGFTGTSLWIDPKKKLGQVFLTNETLGHWYDRKNLNDLRRRVGEIVWSH
jgi:CubicO group peptidase (beta-lactamase class C family)